MYTRVKCEYLSPKCTLLSALHSHSLSSLNVIDSSYDTRLGRLPIYVISYMPLQCPACASLAGVRVRVISEFRRSACNMTNHSIDTDSVDVVHTARHRAYPRAYLTGRAL